MGLSRYITLSNPEMLIVGAALVWLYARRLRHRNLWRTVAVGVAVAALGYPLLVRGSKSIDLYVLADRSRSISDEGRKKETELIDLAGGMLRPGDRIGVVSFADRAYAEQAPQPGVTMRGFENPAAEDASDLNAGLELTLNQAAADRAARILVLSDGEFTGLDPVRAAWLARQAKVPIYYRDLGRRAIHNLAVRDVQIPEKTLTGEPYRIAFQVNATYATAGRYRLLRDGRPVASEAGGEAGWRPYTFEQGDNAIEFVDATRQAGIHRYRLEVEPDDPTRETMTRDNAAERYISVIGERPVLVVNGSGQPDNVTRALTAGGLAANVVAIGNYRLGIGQLAGYSAVVLNNVPVLGLTMEQLRDLRSYVEQEGGGLILTGGKRSFGAGGYYKTAIEPILPVSLEDRQQKKKVATAFSIVIDRSGSMMAQTPSGQQKIELAGNAAAESIALMSPADSLSVVVVDSLAHIIMEQQPVENPGAMMHDVRAIHSEGGGIFVYTGLVAGGRELLGAPQLNKHLLLFADANDSEEPGDYKNLLDGYVKAGMTVSVVGLGTEHDSDAEFLKDIAARGKGSIYFTEDAAQLAQFFTADTLNYTRNSFVEDPAPMAIRAGALALAPGNTWKDFTAGGYNLTFKRPEAELDIVTADEDQAPVLAHWQRGLGRVATLALDTQGPFVDEPQFADMVLATTRWATGSEVFDNFQVRVGYRSRTAHITMEIAEEQRDKIGQAQAVIYAPDGTATTRPMRWESYDRLAADVHLDQTGLYRGVIRIGDQVYRIGPMSVPVSPEFLYEHPPEFGHEKLAELARISGGEEALELGPLFQIDRQVRSIQPFVTPLLVILLLMLLADVAEARFAMLPKLRAVGAAAVARARGGWWRPRRVRQPAGVPEPAASEGSAQLASSARPEPAGSEPLPAPGRPAPAAPAPEPPKPGGGLDYLGRSKAQAQRNLQKPRRD